MRKFIRTIVFAAVFCGMFAAGVHACTGLFVKAGDGAVIYARSLEFGIPLNSQMILIPRDTEFQGITPDGVNGAKWKNTYGIVGMNYMGETQIVDGMNEKGLQCGLFYFPGFAGYADYDPAQADKSISVSNVGTWILSRFATVAEVREHINDVRVVTAVTPKMGIIVPGHFLVVDATGDAVVIEYVGGKLFVYDNPIGVITNAPTFDWHIMNLRNYVKLSPDNAQSTKIRDFTVPAMGNGSGMIGIPGDITPPSRFVRAAFYLNSLLHVDTAEEAIKSVMRLHQTFYIAKGMARYVEPGSSEMGVEYTAWEIYTDLKNLKFYFSTYDNLNMRMVDVAKLDFTAGPVRRMEINQPEKFQDLTDQLKTPAGK